MSSDTSPPPLPKELSDDLVLGSDFVVGSYYEKSLSITAKVTYLPLSNTVEVSPNMTINEFIAAGLYVMAAKRYEDAYYPHAKALEAHNLQQANQEVPEEQTNE